MKAVNNVNSQLLDRGQVDTSGLGPTETIDRSNVGSERTSGSIGVSRRAARTSSDITKSPAADDGTNTTGRHNGKARPLGHLGRVWTSNSHKAQSRIDRYRNCGRPCSHAG